MKADEARKIALEKLVIQKKDKDKRRNELIKDILENIIPEKAKFGKFNHTFYIHQEGDNWHQIYGRHIGEDLNKTYKIYNKIDRDIIINTLAENEYRIDVFQEIKKGFEIEGTIWKIEVSW